MAIGDVRALAFAAQFALYGVTATLTPPSGVPLTATGIWLPDLVDQLPVGHDLQRRESRRVMAFRRSEVADVPPRGSVVEAAEYGASAARTWKVDGLELVTAEQVRVLLVATS